MALRLSKIESHALSLLQKEFSSNSGNEWGGFISSWQPRLGEKFPFGSREGWGHSDTVNNNVRKLMFVTQTKNDLHDFFFAPDKGLEAFAKRYNLTAADSSAADATFLSGKPEKLFFENCLAWRDFLFDKDGRPRKHQIRITLDDKQGENSLNAQKYFTQLLMSGLENDKDKSIRLRFSGQKFKSATINWDIGSSADVSMEAKNEETGVTTEIQMSGGSLALPAYVYWEGKRLQADPSGELPLNMLFPKVGLNGDKSTDSKSGGAGSSYYVVPITMSWDQALPENILWPSK
jgi:hypothetical protein